MSNEQTEQMSAQQYKDFLVELHERAKRLEEVTAHLLEFGEKADLAWMQRHLNPASYLSEDEVPEQRACG